MGTWTVSRYLVAENKKQHSARREQSNRNLQFALLVLVDY